MKILMTGANGCVGSGLMKHLPLEKDAMIPIGLNVNSTLNTLVDIDLLDFRKINNHINNTKPDVIIHLAGNKDIFKCETDKILSRKINYEVSENLIEQCLTRKIRLIYLSTDYVFDGINGPFHESSCPKPTTQYGKDKLATENLITSTLQDYTIVRSAGIFGLKRDFVDTVVNALKNKETFCAYTNLKNSPAFIKDLSLILRIILNKEHIGTFHCAGAESLSRYDFAIKIAETFHLEKELIVPTMLDLANDIRPPDLSMNCSWTYKTLNYYPDAISKTLESNYDNWKN